MKTVSLASRAKNSSLEVQCPYQMYPDANQSWFNLAFLYPRKKKKVKVIILVYNNGASYNLDVSNLDFVIDYIFLNSITVC